MAASVLADVARTVAAFRAAGAEGELELRLGHRGGEQQPFRAGVTRDVFDQLERDLLDAATLVADATWTEVVDYFYLTADGQRARTRVEVDREHIQLRPVHLVKQTRESVVLCRPSELGGEACRVAMATEVPLADPPRACIPTHVRIKQRRTFRDVREEQTVWSYELSRVWAASSREAAEQLQRHGEPVYEVECELTDAAGSYLAAHDDARVAASVLLKARRLLGDADDAALEATHTVHHQHAAPHAPDAATPAKRRRR